MKKLYVFKFVSFCLEKDKRKIFNLISANVIIVLISYLTETWRHLYWVEWNLNKPPISQFMFPSLASGTELFMLALYFFRWNFSISFGKMFQKILAAYTETQAIKFV